jgi:hypothetical protein
MKEFPSNLLHKENEIHIFQGKMELQNFYTSLFLDF